MKKVFSSYKGVLPKIGERVFIADSADIIGRVTIGNDSSVWYQAVLRGDINEISVGRCTNIQDGTVVHISKDYSVSIGNNVTIGHNAIIHACHIEDNVLIGMGACVLDGAVISRNSIVGAKALVTKGKVYEEGVLILGSPAKAVRKLTQEEIESISLSALHYTEFAKEFMKE